MGFQTGRQRWDGGYVYRQDNGVEVWVIERQVGSERFHVSTRCNTATAAYEHLKRFQADPWRYRDEMAAGRQNTGALPMTAEMLAKFHDWMLTRPKPATRRHANEMRHRLMEWAEDLGGKSLRSLDLRTLTQIVDRRKTCRQHRIIALKGLMAWLRTKEFLVDRAADVTLDLHVPQGDPEKHKRVKVAPPAHVKKAMAKLDTLRRDCLLVRARTGWHITELARFIRDPASNIAKGKGRVLAVLQTRHKSGATTRTPVSDKRALEAAKRLRRYGAMPTRINAALRRACAKAKVPFFEFGQVRHSVATWAIERGSSPEAVAEFLGHKDKRTTLKFYADVAVPTVGVNLPRL